VHLLYVSLKGHRNESKLFDNSVRHRSLPQLLKSFRFWRRVRGDIRDRKPTPFYQEYTRGVAKKS
jgi:hypothetical protein